jgi:hypothetical protein
VKGIIMDLRVLSALTTTALCAHGGKPDQNITIDISNGTAEPGDIAQRLLLQRYRDHGIRVHDWVACEAAFTLALQVAAKILRDPSKVPDIDDELLKARHHIGLYALGDLEDLKSGCGDDVILLEDSDLEEALQFANEEKHCIDPDLVALV